MFTRPGHPGRLLGQESVTALRVGESVPEVQLTNLDGKTLNLSKILNQRKTLLVFYRGSWCPMCNMQIAQLQKEFHRFQEREVEIIAISTDIPEGGAKTQLKTEAQFPILLDLDGSVIKAFGVRVDRREWMDLPALIQRKHGFAIPSVFLIDKDGTVLDRYIGQSYKDRPTIEVLIAMVDSHVPGE